MTVHRTDIERALDEIISNEEGMRFQGIAVVLAKQACPTLIACERKKDLGLDAHASVALASDGIGRGLACSITATLEKIEKDAEKAKKNFAGLRVLIFATPRGVTNHTAQQWAQAIREKFDLELILMPREDLIASLMLPSNAAICRGQLGLSITLDDTNAERLAKVRDASSKVLDAWIAHPGLSGKPLIALTSSRLLPNGAESRELLKLTDIPILLSEGRRIVVEAPAGRGKTTTLVQIANLRRQEGQLAFLIDLPDWIRSQKSILEFLALTPQFASRSISSQHIAELINDVQFTFLLNGWNEISEQYEDDALRVLTQLEREFPSAGIVVATRTHTITPPLPGAIRLRLRPFSDAQRREYLSLTLGNRADALRDEIYANRALNELTRIPLILSEVVTLFQSNSPIPRTKIGVLDAVMRLMEQSEHHRGFLSRPPLQGLSRDYLEDIAVEMTREGGVRISDQRARDLCSTVNERLRSAGQIAVPAEPSSILNVLCAHHVLERLEYPSSAYRFQHQQFQEFFAAHFLERELAALSAGDEQAKVTTFAKDYVNRPIWSEPLGMIAEDIGDAPSDGSGADQALQAGKRLVDTALLVDPLLASQFSQSCGPLVWREIGPDVGAHLRAWYKSSSWAHRQCALQAMLATGSPDFADILLPLLTSDDQQVRLRLYRTGDNFYLSTLGSKWLQLVQTWPEGARADFAVEMVRRGWRTDAGDPILLSDPSPYVATQIVEGIVWMGDKTGLDHYMATLDDASFASAIQRIGPENIPSPVRSRAVTTFQASLLRTPNPIQRIGILRTIEELGDGTARQKIKEELNALPPTPIGDGETRVLQSVLESLAGDEPAWTNSWVTGRVLDGFLWSDHWLRFVTDIPDTLREQLLARIGTKVLDHHELSRVTSILTRGPSDTLGAQVFSKVCELRRTIANPRDPSSRSVLDICRQLEDLFKALPIEPAVTGLLECASGEFDPVQFREAAHLFGSVGPEEQDPRELSANVRSGLRTYFKKALPFVLAQPDLGGDLKMATAVTLGRVGEAEDIAEIEMLIRADIRRVREGRAALMRGERNEATNGATMSWTNWYVRALEWLGMDVAEPLLLDLLLVPEYESDAGMALIRFAAKGKPDSAPFSHPLDYQAIWNARGGDSLLFDDDRRKRFSEAVHRRIATLQDERARAADPDKLNGSLKTYAFMAALLDGRNSASIVLGIEALPGKWDGWHRVRAINALLLSGASLGAREVLKALDPVIAHSTEQGLHDDQNVTLLIDCLRILPFVREPEDGVDRIRQVLADTALRNFHLRRVAAALGYSRCESASRLLIELAKNTQDGTGHVDVEWIDALANAGSPEAREALLSFIDPSIPELRAGQSLDWHSSERLAAHIAKIALSNPAIKDRLLALPSRDLSPARRELLAKVFAHIGTQEAAFASLQLVSDRLTPPIPQNVAKAIEHLFVEHRPANDNPNAYSLVPRDANRLRERLFEMVIDDEARRNSAFEILGRIELWRLEYGRPNSETRHPAFDSGKPWPLIEGHGDGR